MTELAWHVTRLVIVTGRTYHRPLEVLSALPELLQSLILCCRPIDDRTNVLLPHIFQDSPELICGWGILSDVQFEFLTGA